MVLKLYAAPLSTASLRVAQVLHEKKVPFEFYPVDLAKKEQKAEAYLEKHPFGQVPYIVSVLPLHISTSCTNPDSHLQDDDGFILYESRAIARYIALKYPDQGTPLVPSPTDLQAWALFEQAASLEYSNFELFAKQIVFEKVFKPCVTSFHKVISRELIAATDA